MLTEYPAREHCQFLFSTSKARRIRRFSPIFLVQGRSGKNCFHVRVCCLERWKWFSSLLVRWRGLHTWLKLLHTRFSASSTGLRLLQQGCKPLFIKSAGCSIRTLL